MTLSRTYRDDKVTVPVYLFKLIMGGKVLATMKLFRTIAVILILVLATSPALANVCATSCASKSIISAVNSDDMSTMMHCHEAATHKEFMSSDKPSSDNSSSDNSSSDNSSSGQPGTEHKSCAMGSGCHFSQATPVESTSKYALIDTSAITFPHFSTSEKSVDLSPPLKPPA